MAVVYRLQSRKTALPRAELIVFFWNSSGVTVGTAAERRTTASLLKRIGARGKSQEMTPLSVVASATSRLMLAVGYGENLTLDTYRRGVAAGVQLARQHAIRDITILSPEGFRDGEALGVATVEGVELGRYLFTKYQADAAKRERLRSLQRVTLQVSAAQRNYVRAGLGVGKIFTDATILARDLVNEPASHATPKTLADDARRIAKTSRGRVTVEILDRAECEKHNMGAFLAVAQGSMHPPYFIHLIYTPAKNSKFEIRNSNFPVVALVGKGVTFDSGGLSLKPADSMETMKIDMAGAASVFAVFSALPKLNLPVVVHGYVPACENMPSGSAIRPGDIVRSASGKTIEIRNTDAEGRLLLADALTEAKTVKPAVIIDLATLTGACVVALGEEVTGLFANDDTWARRLEAAAHRSGEAVWRLPLVQEYREQLKSTIADLKNVTGRRWAGAITAALFLQEFVGKTPWIHLDIAGPSYAEQQVNPVVPTGASGFGVRTLLRFLQRLTEKSESQK